MSSISEIRVTHVRAEHLRETLGIGTSQPRLSWRIETDAPNWIQAAYELECQRASGQQQTGRLDSDQSVLVDWVFAPLRSRERVSVRVRVWGKDGGESAWSEPLTIETGLLDPADWSAQFISPAWDEDTALSNPAPYLRREFEVRAGMKSARLYSTALGVYEAQINGERVGDHVLAPGWTVYDQRLRYQTFDVTALLREGRNAIGAILGDGWYRGRLGFGGGQRNIWGDRLALFAQLEIEYDDGTSERIVTDERWRAATGAILNNSLYDGETYDARLERFGWSLPGYDDTDWSSVRPLVRDLNKLEAPISPPIRRIERISPLAITRSPSGKVLVDFGQNLVGWLNITVNGSPGQIITLRHAEVLENGELSLRPLRIAEATDRYILRGEGVETWEPRFTFHGFRYAEVTGWSGELNPADICAVVIHSDLERTGWFECSDPLLNQLHKNVVWGMRGNFVDVPTDCPQRDERLGWTGDIQIFAPTATYLFDVSGFLQSWLIDLAHEQRKAGGVVAHVVPHPFEKPLGTAAWGDAATVVPWVHYLRFGDLGILRDQFESMRAWVDHVASVASPTRLWDKGFQFGDWLDPAAPPDNPGQARTDKAIVATAYFARSAALVARAAELLGYGDDQRRYQALADEVRAAFAREYVTPSGRVMSDAETGYALALEFDLLPTAEQRQHAGRRLMELVRASGYHIRTGFVGTPLICDALCHSGYADAAYRLLLQQDCPSWLYPVTMGATTVWERWDSMLPDGSINPGEMTSFNHYALGAVADWMHRTIGGIAPAEPGYRRSTIQPHPGGGLTYAHAHHQTPYGLIQCQWEIKDGHFNLHVVVPPNTTAQVTLPGNNSAVLDVGSGTWQWSVPFATDVRTAFTLDDYIGDVASDKVRFDALMKKLNEMGAPLMLLSLLKNDRGFTLREAVELQDDFERWEQVVVSILVGEVEVENSLQSMKGSLNDNTDRKMGFL
jgi:alpha-L-rhamnosidase